MSLKVAVTGGIGSGKSLVCKAFSALGIPVYVADEHARSLMNTAPELKAALVALFGDELYDAGGLRRKWLAGKIFGNEALLSQVNKLVHPAVHRDFLRWAAEYSDFPYVIEEAALTFESGADRLFDRIIVVDAPEEVRIRRVMDRDGVSEEEVRARMQHQIKQEEKVRKADYVIFNDDRNMVLPQILALHTELENLK